MTVSVDTNVLLDLLEQDASLRARAVNEIDAMGDEVLIICEAVYAELANRFDGPAALDRFLTEIGIHFVPSDAAVLFLAGTAWVKYARLRPEGLMCGACGRETAARCGNCGAVLSIRQRVLPDFYVGAHALLNADRLLTRDRRYFQRYFPEVRLV